MISDSSLELLTPIEREAIGKAVLSHITAPAALITITTNADARASFARNDVRAVGGSNANGIAITVEFPGGKRASATTTRIDPDGLRAVAAEVEQVAKQLHSEDDQRATVYPPTSFTDPPIYFATTVVAGDTESQSNLIRRAAEMADAAGLVGAGDFGVVAGATTIVNSGGFVGHTRRTWVEFSMTVRTRAGTGSGWAWAGHEDASRIDARAIAEQAIELARRTDKPSAVEPGRYTVILEPAAVESFVNAILGDPTQQMNAEFADVGYSAFSRRKGEGRYGVNGNKIGLKMMDERVHLLSDPDDSLMPFSPMGRDGNMIQRTSWLDRGILRNLAYSDFYAQRMQRARVDNPGFATLQVVGPTQALDAMIADTKRGIWVHRLSNVVPVDQFTLLMSGVTRDGTFLIENGKVTRPIKNLRFLESPFFVLNKIDTAGTPVRASANLAVPRLKVHDFAFTSLSDAV